MLKKMLKKINKKNANVWIAVVLSIVLFISGCGSAATDSVEDSVTENTEALEMMEATESLELTEVTEAVEVAETSEAIEVAEIEMVLETETSAETASESAVEKEVESGAESEEKETYSYTDLNKTMYAKQSVNVRDLPSTDGSKLGSLKSGQSVTVTGQCNETGWYQISYNGGTGYCSDNYLTSTKPSSGSSGSGSSGSSSSGSSSSGSKNSGTSGSSTDNSTTTYYYIKDYTSKIADKIIELTNEERVAAGVSKLSKSDVLTGTAEIRAEEQVQSFGHTRPDGSSWRTVFDEVSYDSSSISVSLNGENCVYFACSYKVSDISAGIEEIAKEAVLLWMNSAGHKENMLSSEYDSMGVGVYYSNGMIYCVQNFGSETKFCSSHTWVNYSSEYTYTAVLADGTVSDELLCYCSVCEAEMDINGNIYWHGVRKE